MMTHSTGQCSLWYIVYGVVGCDKGARCLMSPGRPNDFGFQLD